MNSLTSVILQNRNKQVRLGTDDSIDELGIPKTDQYGNNITNTPGYMVCRALLRDKKEEPYEEDTVNRLHTRDGIVYRSNKEIEATTENFYLLTGVVDNVKYGLRLCFWQELKRRIPKLDQKIIKIADGMYWDSKNGEIFNCKYEYFCKKLKKEGR